MCTDIQFTKNGFKKTFGIFTKNSRKYFDDLGIQPTKADFGNFTKVDFVD